MQIINCINDNIPVVGNLQQLACLCPRNLYNHGSSQVRGYQMSKIKDIIIDVTELMQAGLSFDQIVDCTDYPDELIRQVFQRYGFSNLEVPEYFEFEDVPY